MRTKCTCGKSADGARTPKKTCPQNSDEASQVTDGNGNDADETRGYSLHSGLFQGDQRSGRESGPATQLGKIRGSVAECAFALRAGCGPRLPAVNNWGGDVRNPWLAPRRLFSPGRVVEVVPATPQNGERYCTCGGAMYIIPVVEEASL